MTDDSGITERNTARSISTKEEGLKPVRWKHMEKITGAIVKPIAKMMGEQFNLLADRIKALEAKEFPYQGVYQRANEYQRGMFVTFKGSMWYCCVGTTRQQPGTGSDWQLAVKGSE